MAVTPPNDEFDWKLCRYGSFYDVPNGWAGPLRGLWVRAARAFDDELDDYPDFWTVEEIAPLTIEEFHSVELFWLSNPALRKLPNLPVSSLRFHSKRIHLPGQYFAWYHDLFPENIFE